MYTGIVQAACELKSVERLEGLHRLVIPLPAELLGGLVIGASVAADGVCLTVTAIHGCDVSFDVMQQTLSLTSLGQLQVGDRVNIERSAKWGDEVGGHPISGHVDGTAEVVALEESANNRRVSYRVPVDKMPYIFEKGFIALNGCSLTVAAVDRDQATLTVSYIPETLRVTTHGEKALGDRVNFELDRQTQAIVDTVQRVLQANPSLLKA